MARDYYTVLGLPQGTPLAQIRIAYRNLAALYHPDKFSSASPDEQAAATLRMMELNEAMSVLGNVEKRSAYDRDLKAAASLAARTRGKEGRTSGESSSSPQRHPSQRPAPSPVDAPPGKDRGVQNRIAALKERILKVPVRWTTLTSSTWAWLIESNDSGGRPLLIAHRHSDLLESKDTRALDRAVDRLLDMRGEKLRSPWIVILLSSRRMPDPARLLPALDDVAKRSRGWLKKRPMILLYDERLGRVLRFGDPPEHEYMEQVLNLLLHP
jgi:curved DNA-binding protein CbpA